VASTVTGPGEERSGEPEPWSSMNRGEMRAVALASARRRRGEFRPARLDEAAQAQSATAGAQDVKARVKPDAGEKATRPN